MKELRELLRIYAGHVRAHYELARTYDMMGRSDDARTEYTAFLDAWSEADDGLSELQDARMRLRALKPQ